MVPVPGGPGKKPNQESTPPNPKTNYNGAGSRFCLRFMLYGVWSCLGLRLMSGLGDVG